MKKFITVIPMQPTDRFNAVHYSAHDGDTILANDIETRFPVMILIRNTAVRGETIAVNIVVADNNEYIESNRQLFIVELEKIKNDVGFDYELTEIRTSMEETADKQLALFGSIIASVNENDELYADVTYGAKPTPMVIMMVLNYAYDLCKNTTVESVIYGNDNEVYEITSLFHINSVVQKMAVIRPADPLGFINNIIAG